LKHVLQTFLYKLVGPANQIKLVDVIELQGGNICLKKRKGDRKRKGKVEILASYCNKRNNITLTSEVTLDPKSQPAPRGLTAQVSISSGSLHMRSQKGPSWGISQFRSMTLICQVKTQTKRRTNFLKFIQ